MTNVSTGNIDTHPESEKIKLIKAKKKGSIHLWKCVSAEILSITLREVSQHLKKYTNEKFCWLSYIFLQKCTEK